MKQRRTDRVLLGVSIGGFSMMSISFLLMPIKGTVWLPGIMFWAGLILGSVLQIVLEWRRRVFFTSYNVKRQKMQKPRNGLLSFKSNQEAVIVDYTLAISFVATVIAFILTKGYGYVCYVLIAITLSSFWLHCIFNGRIYFHAKNQQKVQQVLEQNKANTTDKGEGKK